MGETITLTASDGHPFSAYGCHPENGSKGGVVVCQEIFGVNTHIRAVCDDFVKEGYTAIAPALYDRSSSKNCQLDYSEASIELGRKLREEFDWADTMRDVDAAADWLREQNLKVAVVGYCWGGTIAYLAATRLKIQGAVVYYGGQIMPYVDESANCPLLMHFGKNDQSIPLSDVDSIRQKHPEAAIFLYNAGHGFNCDHRASYDSQSASTAKQRTLRLFDEVLS